MPDGIAAGGLLSPLLRDALVVPGDRSYDTIAGDAQIMAPGAFPDIPPKRSRLSHPEWPEPLYRNRNAIERMFGPLK
jgi:hypothetical protein